MQKLKKPAVRSVALKLFSRFSVENNFEHISFLGGILVFMYGDVDLVSCARVIKGLGYKLERFYGIGCGATCF